MTKKKKENYSKLPFSELKEKAKEIDGSNGMNRFEITKALKKSQGEAVCCCSDPDKCNPRNLKPEINALKKQLAQLPKSEKKARKELREKVSNLKRSTRCYL